MNSILATEKGLPPGLWLPRAEEPTEKYLRENFSRSDLTDEDVLDYGMFVVALIVLDKDCSSRISTAPNTDDFNDLSGHGYGISYQTLRRHHGGPANLNSKMGYFSSASTPNKDTIMKRLAWIGNYAYERDEGTSIVESGVTLRELVNWAAVRNYLPSRANTLRVFEGDTTKARQLLNIEYAPTRVHREYHSMYKLGAKIINENNGPVTHEAFKLRYNHGTEYSANVAITELFGTYTNFCLEFGYVPTTLGLQKSDIVDMGVRYAIRNKGHIVNGGDVTRLSAEKRFASLRPIKSTFGGVEKYGKAVSAKYDLHIRNKRMLETADVDVALLAAIEHNHIFTGTTLEGLRANIPLLKCLEFGESFKQFFLGILTNGFNLLDDTIFDIQLNDLLAGMERSGINDTAKRYILSLIPRINPDEALEMTSLSSS